MSFFLLTGCGIRKHIQKPVVLKDTVIIHKTDSILIEKRDTVIQTPKEFYKNFEGLNDTLVLETSLAISKSFINTDKNVIEGFIQNKDVKMEHKEIQKELKVIKDSVIVYKNIPYEVEIPVKYIPKFYKVCTGILIGLLCLMAILGILKLKRIV